MPGKIENTITFAKTGEYRRVKINFGKVVGKERVIT